MKRLRINRNDATGYLFVLPTLIGMLLFSFYPILEALRLSFYRHDGIRGTWVGLYNYESVLNDRWFWISMKNTIYIGVMTMVAGLFLSLVIASLIHVLTWKRGKNVLKSLYFAPNVTSFVAASMLF